MIDELRIRALGVIEDALLELGPGLTVVTGETGAGKTMVVTALGLLLGGRADPAAVRAGNDHAVVEGRVRVDIDGPVARRATEAGASLDDGCLLLARTVSATGRTRAHVGGRSAPVGLLGELGADLVAVHGQSDQLLLLQPARQRAALDRFGGDAVAGPLGSYRSAYARHRAVEDELAAIVGKTNERVQEAELLRFGLEKVAAVAPLPGEDVQLAAEADRLGYAEELRLAAATAHANLLGDGAATESDADAVGLVGEARRTLDAVREHDTELAAIGDRLSEVAYLLADAAADLASYAAGVSVDPLRLAAVEERRAALISLMRSHGPTLDDAMGWAERARARLEALEADAPRTQELIAEREALATELRGLAGQVSEARTAAAHRFGAAVTRELAALAMPDAEVSVEVSAGDELGPHGCDDVTLMLSAHAGAEPRPIARGASGGELSRVMLAVEVVFAGADPMPTLVFDEVDAGVGGRAAVEVGTRLARLARTAQVVVVTHLPQVAAFADQHVLVEKSSDGAVTSSGLSALDESGRVRELTRMLAGLADSESGALHAKELLAAAAASKAG